MNAETEKCVGCERLSQEFQHLRSQWCWLLLFGVLLLICGTVAILYPILSTFATMVVLGIVLMVAGVATMINAFWAGKWSGTMLQLFIGTFYLVLGIVIKDLPFRAALAMTFIIAAFFIVTGGFRIVAALTVRFPFWGWSLLNGIVTFLMGVIIYRHFPETALWVVGLLIGIEMLFHGWTWIMVSLAVRRIPAAPASPTV
ncbi:MAG: HdeD family acid-resistance protein [Thermoguttaceae bacterium]